MPADQGLAIASEIMASAPNVPDLRVDEKRSEVAEVKASEKKPETHSKPRVQFKVPPQSDTPKPCRKRKHKLKQQIAVVVQDLETVISELSSVVGELRGVLVQIEKVSTELDATMGRRGVKVNKLPHRNPVRCVASDSSQERLDSPELLRMSARMRRRISAKSRRCSALCSKPKSESESSLATEPSPRKEIRPITKHALRKACSQEGTQFGLCEDESDYGTKSDAESLLRGYDSQGNCSCASSTRHTATSDGDRLSNIGTYSDFEIVVSPELALRSEFLMRSPALSRLSTTSCSDAESSEFHADYNRDINTWTTYALVHIDAPSNSDTWDSDREVCV